MAIEVKKKINIKWFPIVMGLVFIVFGFATTYFLFFKLPPLIEVFRPTLDIDEQRQKASRILLAPERVVGSATFEMLTEIPVSLEAEEVGNLNPYIPFPTEEELASSTEELASSTEELELTEGELAAEGEENFPAPEPGQ